MSKSATLTVLSDNHTTARNLRAEHGLSCLVETAGANILFDTGASSLFSENARHLKIELYGVESIVLSHGHYDHAEGLERALFEAPAASLVLHKAALEPKLARNREGHMFNVGMSSETAKAVLRAEADGRATFIDGPVRLGPNIIVFPTGPRDAVNPSWPYFTQTQDGQFAPDLFPDELCMLVLGDAKASLVVGDAHTGFLNCWKRALELAGGRKMEVVVGGSCMSKCDADEIQAIADILANSETKLFLGHATGMDGYAVLRRMLGPKAMPLRVGLQLDLGS